MIELLLCATKFDFGSGSQSLVIVRFWRVVVGTLAVGEQSQCPAGPAQEVCSTLCAPCCKRLAGAVTENILDHFARVYEVVGFGPKPVC